MIQMTEALAAQIDRAEQLREERGDSMQISRDQGELQCALGLAHQVKTVVEIGTSYGFSGMWWLAALSKFDGHLHTFDISEKKYTNSRQAFEAAGVGDRVTSYLGDAIDLLPQVTGEIDIVFIDADKDRSQTYFDMLWSQVRVGGAVLTDNVLSHRKEMGPYIDYLRNRDDAHSTTIPIRAGLEYTVKLK
jgi:predicted O-methyltransferase YrrM